MATANTSPTNSFEALVADALAHPIQGWHFGYVAGRYIGGEPPWSYLDGVLPYIEKANALLDVDTGDGAAMLALHQRAQRWPTHCWATEAYEPNIPIATAALAAINVQVAAYQPDAPLPFATATPTEGFDLIINRHGSMMAREYARLLKAGGHFVTQQVGGEMNSALNRLLDGPPMEYGDWTLARAVQDLQEAGFAIIVTREARPAIQFTDIGAIVWYLQAVPWQIPGFTVKQYEGRLRQLHEQIQETGAVQSQGHAFYIEARKITKALRTF